MDLSPAHDKILNELQTKFKFIMKPNGLIKVESCPLINDNTSSCWSQYPAKESDKVTAVCSKQGIVTVQPTFDYNGGSEQRSEMSDGSLHNNDASLHSNDSGIGISSFFKNIWSVTEDDKPFISSIGDCYISSNESSCFVNDKCNLRNGESCQTLYHTTLPVQQSLGGLGYNLDIKYLNVSCYDGNIELNTFTKTLIYQGRINEQSRQRVTAPSNYNESAFSQPNFYIDPQYLNNHGNGPNFNTIMNLGLGGNLNNDVLSISTESEKAKLRCHKSYKNYNPGQKYLEIPTKPTQYSQVLLNSTTKGIYGDYKRFIPTFNSTKKPELGSKNHRNVTPYPDRGIFNHTKIESPSHRFKSNNRFFNAVQGVDFKKTYPSLVLQFYLEGCFTQLKALEKERKMCEADLARTYPGRYLNSENNILIPSLPPVHPSRIDRMILDHCREYARVYTLFTKMNNVHNSDQLILPTSLFQKIERWVKAITEVGMKRGEEILRGSSFYAYPNVSQPIKKFQDEKDVFALSFCIKELERTTKLVRTALWTALTITVNSSNTKNCQGSITNPETYIGLR